MSSQTGLAPPVLGGAKPVRTDIRTTPYFLYNRLFHDLCVITDIVYLVECVLTIYFSNGSNIILILL